MQIVQLWEAASAIRPRDGARPASMTALRRLVTAWKRLHQHEPRIGACGAEVRQCPFCLPTPEPRFSGRHVDAVCSAILAALLIATGALFWLGEADLTVPQAPWRSPVCWWK